MSRFLVATLLLSLGICVQAEDKPASPELDPQAMQEMFMKLAQPGPQHEQLKSLVGKWHCECKTYEPDPNNPVVSEGSSEFREVLGGRFIEQTFTGNFQGMKFEGRGLSGFDNGQQKLVGTWVDNFGTGIMHIEGTFDEATNTSTEIGTVQTPIGEMKMKMIGKHLSEDKYHFTMYMVNPDGEKKHMEILYTRKK